MNIGILSMQKILNYGSFLQALSLKLQFESRGHNVYFIDIIEGRHIVISENKATPKSYLSKIDKYVLKRIENYILSKRMSKIHVSDYEKYLETNKKLPKGEKFDLVVIGSDEVFNATAPSRWGFSTQLFGKIDNADRIVTYAASCGSTTFESAKKYGIVDELADSMKNLERISVRDKNTYDFVNKITGHYAEINVDPVFITNYDRFIVPIKKRKPYLLVYAYVNRINNEKEISAIKEYAQKHGLDILSVGTQQRWCNNNIAANAFELLSYVKNAECIITDTFHGTVFSIKYNKKFAVLIRESNRNKLGGLLSQFDLMSRSVEDPRDMENVLSENIDYSAVNGYVKNEQERSYRYLDEITNTRV